MDNFVPDIYLQNIFVINYQNLKKRGIKCIIFDLDNTIAAYDTDEPSKEIKELFYLLKTDFKLIIMSNSTKNRVRPFKEKLNVDTAFLARKPFKKKFKKILDMYNYKGTEIAFVGDQLLTDILGANRMAFTSILINPISPNEPIRTRINRSIERKIKNKLMKKGVNLRGEYYE